MPAKVELITTEDFQDFQNKMVDLVNELRSPMANALDRYLTIEDIMEFTQTSYSTVYNWIKLGKKDRHDNIYKLEAEEFAPGQHRVLRSKLIAYGQIKGCVAITRERKKVA